MPMKYEVESIQAQTAAIRRIGAELKAEMDAMDCALCGDPAPFHYRACPNHPDYVPTESNIQCKPGRGWCNQDGCSRCNAEDRRVI